MTDGWMHGIAAAVAQNKPGRIGNIIHDIRAGLDEQMDEEAEPAGTVGGSDRHESGRATGGDVAAEPGGGEPSGAAEALEK